MIKDRVTVYDELKRRAMMPSNSRLLARLILEPFSVRPSVACGHWQCAGLYVTSLSLCLSVPTSL